MSKIKPITIEIEDSLWEEFKKTVNKTTTLNDAVVELINNKIKDQ